jgi:transcriptional regulator with XRE-family HTH domain
MATSKPHLKELADFLKTRRDRLTPADVGLPSGTRRRTPGLRREEVAQLVNVSTTWYTFLEQGRDIRVSTQVLESLAQALRLTSEERTHLFMLALQQLPPEIPHGKSTVSPAIQRMLDHLVDCPAYVVGYRFDILAWNQAACALFGDFGQMTTRERNKIWYFFTNAAHRQMLVNWEGQAQLMLARFRSICGRYLGDVKLMELADDLKKVSPEFRQWWSQHDVQARLEGFKAYDHPIVGSLEFEYALFQVTDAPELTLVVYTPLPESGTVEQLQQLKTLVSKT